ncbi:MAG: DUF3810 domain-containing protein [Ruminococcus sp.]|nr:DUF3810 domain-containing protein [Ruminococcus sp.]
MYTLFFCIYAVVTLIGIIFFGLREFHTLQLNGYKTPKNNFKRYIFPLIMLLSGCLPFAFDAWTYFLPVFCIAYLIITLFNKPSKSLKYTTHIKRMMTTFFIIVAVGFIWAFLLAKEGKAGSEKYIPFGIYMPYFILNTIVWFTPILVSLSNLINKPFKKYKEIT